MSTHLADSIIQTEPHEQTEASEQISNLDGQFNSTTLNLSEEPEGIELSAQDLVKKIDREHRDLLERKRFVLEAPDSMIDKVKMSIIDEFEQNFINGLTTGTDLLDAIAHTLSHYFEFPLYLIGEMQDEDLVNKYFLRCKLIIQTVVEYLNIQRGIDINLIHECLINFNVTLVRTYDTMNPEDSSKHITVLKFLNTFLPNLLSKLKVKADSSEFGERLIEIINFMKTNSGNSYADLLLLPDFEKKVRELRTVFLNCDQKYIDLVLTKVHHNVSFEVRAADRVTVLVENPMDIKLKAGNLTEDLAGTPLYIRYLSSRGIRKEGIDSTINQMARTIRLVQIPYYVDIFFSNNPKVKNMNAVYLNDIFASSRTSVERTKKNAESRGNPKILQRVEANSDDIGMYIKIFDDSLRSLLSKMPKKTAGDKSFERRAAFSESASILRGMLEDGVSEIMNGENLVRYILQIFETIIIQLDNSLLQNLEMVSDKLILQLFAHWKSMLEVCFENSAKIPSVRLLNTLNYYFIDVLKSDYGIEVSHTELSLEDTDDSPIIEMTTFLAAMKKYAYALEQRLGKKMSVFEQEKPLVNLEAQYEQFVMECFCSAARSPDFFNSRMYYAEDLETLIADFNIKVPGDQAFATMFERTFSRIAINCYQYFGIRVDIKSFATVVSRILDSNIRLKEQAIKILKAKLKVQDNGRSAEQTISAHFEEYVEQFIKLPPIRVLES